jgi:colanic acid/amylovoran biosynthesis glycosyltransferase
MIGKRRIAYIMSRFPGLSETFILREMCEMEKLNWQLELYPLIFQNETVVHAEALDWIDRVHRSSVASILAANFLLFFTRPWLYFSLLWKVVSGNIHSPKFLIRAIAIFPKAVWMARQMLKDHVDHIHAHYATHPALAAWIIYQITGISFSVTVHAHDIFVDKSMLGQKLRDARKIVAISQYNREYLTKYLGPWVTEKIEIIHCGVIPELYVKRAGATPAETSQYNVLSTGSLRAYKGFTHLLDACNILAKKGFSFHCRIVGGGELYEQLLGKIDSLNLQSYVELLGPKTQADVVDLLQRSDCYVQPSVITVSGKMEGIPVSLMEAMASSLPVIATNISGVPELVIHGKTGFLVQPEDSEGLANAIMYEYHHPIEVDLWARAGKEHVLKEFNVSTNVAQLSVMFESFFEDRKWK